MDMSEFWKSEEEIAEEEKEREEEQKRIEALPDQEEVARILKSVNYAIQKVIRVDDLTEEELEEIKNIYPKFEDLEGETIPKGQLLLFGGELYKSLSEHEVDKNYNPAETNYRYVLAAPEGVADFWKQPSGYEDVYNKGDLVIYKPNGKTYVSKIDGNSQEPTKDEPHNRYWEEA